MKKQHKTNTLNDDLYRIKVRLDFSFDSEGGADGGWCRRAVAGLAVAKKKI